MIKLNKRNMGKRALVTSSGGAKGSYAVGIVKHLKEIGIEHDIYIGCSTGSLIAPLAASNEIDVLIDAYTSITTNDIFTISPYKNIKDSSGNLKSRPAIFNIIKNMFIKKSPSLGDSSAIRKSITKFFTKADYDKVIQTNKSLTVCVTNLTLQKTEYKTVQDYSYEDFCDWMQASAAAPPFMSIVTKNGYEYVDGGVLQMIPLQEAINMGAEEVDVIILTEENPTIDMSPTKNVVQFLERLLNMTMSNISYTDIQMGELKVKKRTVVNFYYTPYQLTTNSLIFDKTQMTGWYNLGYEKAKEGFFKSYEIVDGNVKLVSNGLK
jgi:NTE family protein